MSIQSLRTGVSGLNANQTRLDTISNNISNSGTVAFKRGRAAFSEIMGQEILGVSSTAGGSNINPSQVGRGVSVGSVDRDFSQGSLDQTGIQTDLALSGDGFFVASPKEGSGSQQRRLTRAGNFTFNQNGEFVTANGLNVQGWEANEDGKVNTGELKDIQFDPNAQSAAKLTNKAEVGGNLSADAEVGDTSQISSVVYDEKGTAHDIVVEFEKTDDRQWDYRIKSSGSSPFDLPSSSSGDNLGEAQAYVDSSGEFVTDSNGNALTVESENGNAPPDSDGGATVTVYEGFETGDGKVVLDGDRKGDGSGGPDGSLDTDDVITDGDNIPDGTSATTISYVKGQINFNTDGSVETIKQDTDYDGDTDTDGEEVTDQNGPNISWKEDFVKGGEEMALDFSGITQFSGSTTSKFQSQNGNSAGELSDFSITPEGELQLNFTNGEQKKIFQLAIGNVNNPNGLEQQGENFFTTTSASGDLKLGRAGRDLQTSVVSGSLESSNVDLADEFADLIEAQRSYQASSRVVTTADQVLQETVQLKR